MGSGYRLGGTYSIYVIKWPNEAILLELREILKAIRDRLICVKTYLTARKVLFIDGGIDSGYGVDYMNVNDS